MNGTSTVRVNGAIAEGPTTARTAPQRGLRMSEHLIKDKLCSQGPARLQRSLAAQRHGYRLRG